MGPRFADRKRGALLTARRPAPGEGHRPVLTARLPRPRGASGGASAPLAPFLPHRRGDASWEPRRRSPPPADRDRARRGARDRRMRDEPPGRAVGRQDRRGRPLRRRREAWRVDLAMALRARRGRLLRQGRRAGRVVLPLPRRGLQGGDVQPPPRGADRRATVGEPGDVGARACCPRAPRGPMQSARLVAHLVARRGGEGAGGEGGRGSVGTHARATPPDTGEPRGGGLRPRPRRTGCSARTRGWRSGDGSASGATR